ncbi:MAG: hypothetical protein QE271_12575 [Bacteriovoracaceae bacterium]|nr:hypothetical protein [Bacteriovoracaceae bacterium]
MKIYDTLTVIICSVFLTMVAFNYFTDKETRDHRTTYQSTYPIKQSDGHFEEDFVIEASEATEGPMRIKNKNKKPKKKSDRFPASLFQNFNP